MNELKIGAVRYVVSQHDDLHTVNGEGKKQWLHGHILHADAQIKIASDQSEDMKVVTLWHEALHGILTVAAQGEQPETLIEALSYGLVALIRDNPALVEVTLKGLGNAAHGQ